MKWRGMKGSCSKTEYMCVNHKDEGRTQGMQSGGNEGTGVYLHSTVHRNEKRLRKECRQGGVGGEECLE